MSNESATGEGVDTEVPDAVKEWLSSVAADRGLSEIELLRAMLTSGGPETRAETVERHELDRFEQEFRSLIEDVRERVIQVKREADQKAPGDHAHDELANSVDQVGQELRTVHAELEALDERLVGGFDNYEDILTYLTETTDELHRRLSRLASAVIDLREQVGEATRDEVRRTALAHLTRTANRHGVETAKCADCDGLVDISLLVEPRCPHCDSALSSLEPRRGFFRKAVLHTGTMPALESAPVPEDSPAGGLERIVDGTTGDDGDAPSVDPGVTGAGRATEPSGGDGGRTATPSASDPEAPADGDPWTDASDDAWDLGDDGAEAGTSDEPASANGDLQAIDGVGPAYADRLRDAGIEGVAALARADPAELGEAIDVPPATVADWIDQAAARTDGS